MAREMYISVTLVKTRLAWQYAIGHVNVQQRSSLSPQVYITLKCLVYQTSCVCKIKSYKSKSSLLIPRSELSQNASQFRVAQSLWCLDVPDKYSKVGDKYDVLLDLGALNLRGSSIERQWATEGGKCKLALRPDSGRWAPDMSLEYFLFGEYWRESCVHKYNPLRAFNVLFVSPEAIYNYKGALWMTTFFHALSPDSFTFTRPIYQHIYSRILVEYYINVN